MEDAFGMANGPDQPQNGRESLRGAWSNGLRYTYAAHESPCVLAGAIEHANLCSDGVCLQYSLLVWMCVNTQGRAHVGAACLCSLRAVPRLGPFNSGAPATHNLPGEMCLRHLLAAMASYISARQLGIGNMQ